MKEIRFHSASFNIRYDNPVDGANGWFYRKTGLLDLLNYYAWDVIGFQEVLHGPLAELAAGLPDYSYEGEGREGGSLGEYNPIFYRKDRFERVEGGTFWLSLTPDRPSRSWESGCYRICTWLKLRCRETGTLLMFLNTHLDHEVEEARYQGALLLAERIAKLPADMPVVLSGDFNSPRTERAYRMLADALTDARLAAQSPAYGPEGTFTDFRSGALWSELKPIDYLLVSHPVRVLRFRTVTDLADRLYLSDHYPVTAELAVPVPACPEAEGRERL
ncbi:endonuclease/exonuclease/phosphatase family protein [Gorillibacterium timonense]|uniref:endonuclease/exonuclease/phosphatase family protein n=1 Tax=Gorillibacterium timonense TaxID=1689269 RepID=UPI00071CE496|nr:endonuclease/exonuclease/phosphatase family protein [Gorillibacterium timonense]